MAVPTNEPRAQFDHSGMWAKSRTDFLIAGSDDVKHGMANNLALVSPLTIDGDLLDSTAETKIRQCPNSEGGGGGGSGARESTGGCSGRSLHARNQFSYSPPGRTGGTGKGGGDEEDDDHATDYKKKWLNCDRNEPNRTPDRNQGGTSKRSHDDPSKATDRPADSRGTRSAWGSDECDASMAEQAGLLQREWTNQECSVGQVTYSNGYGSVLAFMQRLFALWRSGSLVTPGCSEGVIFTENLTLNDEGQYRFGEEFVSTAELGRGDFGTTRACHDWRTGRKMATKEIQRERFLPFEVLSLAKLRSPFIVRFLGATAEKCALYVHMELVDNALPLEYLAGEGAFLLSSQQRIVHICFQLIGALGCLFQCSVLHRDLNCRNVLLTVGDTVKVIDFSLAVPAPYEQRTTMPGGDIRYLAPEITEGARLLTCSSDQWSCGIIVVSLLRGLPQNDGCERMANRGYHPLHCSHLDHIHPALLELLQLMLTPDPSMRPQPWDLSQHLVFGEDLREELEGYPARIGLDSPDLEQVDGREPRPLYLREGGITFTPGDHSCDEGDVAAASLLDLGAGVEDIATGNSEIPHSDFSRSSEASSKTGHRPVVNAPSLPNHPMSGKVEDSTSGSPGECVGLHEVTSGGCDMKGLDETGASPEVGKNYLLTKKDALLDCGGLAGKDSPIAVANHGGGDCRAQSACIVGISPNSSRGRSRRKHKSGRAQVNLAVSFGPSATTSGQGQSRRGIPSVGDKDDTCRGGDKITNRPQGIDPPGGQTGYCPLPDEIAVSMLAVSASPENDPRSISSTGAGSKLGATSQTPPIKIPPSFKRTNPEDSLYQPGPVSEHMELSDGRFTAGARVLGAPRTTNDVAGENRGEAEWAPQPSSIERETEAILKAWGLLPACAAPPCDRYKPSSPTQEQPMGQQNEHPIERKEEPLEASDPEVMNSYVPQQNLCGPGPYNYPDEWLHQADPEPLVEEGPLRSTSRDRADGPASSHGSSFRGTGQDEEMLVSEILHGQLSMGTDPELQERVYQHFTMSSSLP